MGIVLQARYCSASENFQGISRNSSKWIVRMGTIENGFDREVRIKTWVHMKIEETVVSNLQDKNPSLSSEGLCVFDAVVCLCVVHET